MFRKPAGKHEQEDTASSGDSDGDTNSQCTCDLDKGDVNTHTARLMNPRMMGMSMLRSRKFHEQSKPVDGKQKTCYCGRLGMICGVFREVFRHKSRIGLTQV